MSKENTIKNFMEKLGISREEAEQLYLDDKDDFIGEEGEKMTASAKQTQHREKGERKERKASTSKERKIDLKKAWLFKQVVIMLGDLRGIFNVTTKTETEIHFDYCGESYTWKLTKHKKK